MNPPPTAQIIAVVSLSNSGTVPGFLGDSPWVFEGTVPGFLKGQSLGFLMERIKIKRSHPRHHDDALLDRLCVQGAPNAAARRSPRSASGIRLDSFRGPFGDVSKLQPLIDGATRRTDSPDSIACFTRCEPVGKRNSSVRSQVRRAKHSWGCGQAPVPVGLRLRLQFIFL